MVERSLDESFLNVNWLALYHGLHEPKSCYLSRELFIVFKASQARPPDGSSFGFDFNVAASWRLHRSRCVLRGAMEAPRSLSLRVRRVRL